MKKEIQPSEEITASPAIPQATHSGDLHIGDTEIKCFVLPASADREAIRLLSGRAVTQAFGLSGRGQGLSRFLSAERIRDKMSDKLKQALQEPLEFISQNSGLVPAKGVEAWTLPELCFAIIDANNEKPLPAQQRKMVTQANVLIRGFSLVGITALVDEATGYQEVRAQDALAAILRRFISEELCKWVKTFPDEYYRQLFRLRGLTYSEFTTKRPLYMGKITNDVVYARLAPSVLEALQQKNPRLKGRRKDKHHQWLTEDEGQQRLREHLAAVTALMKASSNWTQFDRNLERALPKPTDQLAFLANEGYTED